MAESKTLILASLNKKEQAILNLKQMGESEIKFFNFNNPNKNFALGIKQGDNITKVPLTIKNNLCKFKMPSSLSLQKNILCAVVDVSNAFCPEIILSGSNNTTNENMIIEENFVAKKPEDTSNLYTQDSLSEIDNLVQKNLEEDLNCTYFDSCSKCKYREAFYNVENSNNSENMVKVSYENIVSDEQIANKKEETDLNKENDNFYEQIKCQIDSLFSKYSEYSALNNIVSNSKWIKINYDNGQDFYVLGLIFGDDKVEYISYGVPSQDGNNPPEDIKEFAQWLPVQNLENNYLGFWLVYQNANDGKTINVDFK